ncbi:hypothetical protein ABZ567_28955 [Streptomyces sp. NPDC016459]|uniref:hypothetical protein n=1 Tax=Streptomyces sp. NPDC016459 TaxID=3157190 RepID=UPI0033E27B72
MFRLTFDPCVCTRPNHTSRCLVLREGRRAEYQAEKEYRAKLGPAQQIGLEGRQWRRDSLENEPWVAPHLADADRAEAARQQAARLAKGKWRATTFAILIAVIIWRFVIPILQELAETN